MNRLFATLNICIHNITFGKITTAKKGEKIKIKVGG